MDEDWPDWIKEKHPFVAFPEKRTNIYAKKELEIYDTELFDDIRKVLKDIKFFKKDWFSLEIAVLHEDGAMTGVSIDKGKIVYFWVIGNEVCVADGPCF
jgi:hypothetical protein